MSPPCVLGIQWLGVPDANRDQDWFLKGRSFRQQRKDLRRLRINHGIRRQTAKLADQAPVRKHLIRGGDVGNEKRQRDSLCGQRDLRAVPRKSGVALVALVVP